MATLSTTANGRPLLVDDVATLLVQPTINLAIADKVATTVTTPSTVFRVPSVTADPSAAWVTEGSEIPVSNATVAELDVTPAKLAGLSVISSELAADSSPAAAQVVGDGLARDMSRRLDAAFFGALPAPAPAGLAALSGVQSVIDAAAFASLDAFITAISLAETVGATITDFAVGPTTALQLAKIKELSGGTRPLLSMGDPTAPSRRMISGVPLHVSAAIPDGIAWALDRSRVWLVVREDSTVIADSSVFFTSDRVAVRGTMRVGFAFPHAASIVRIATA